MIEFQTDANFGATIMQKMNDAGTKVTAIDIPMPGSTFFGVNNPRSGFMGGSYLAQAAIAKWGARQGEERLLHRGELPQSGAIPACAPAASSPASSPRSTASRLDHVHQVRYQEYARGELHADQQRARPHPRRRADHGDGDQRPGDDGHPARRQAGRPRGRPVVVGIGGDEI